MIVCWLNGGGGLVLRMTRCGKKLFVVGILQLVAGGPLFQLILGFVQKFGVILKVSHSNSYLFNIFLNNSQLIVGNGDRIHFWTDTWVGNLSVKSAFPRLFSLSLEKDITLKVVAERWSAQIDRTFRFRRALLGWESDELLRLGDFFNTAGFGLSERVDRLQWMASSSGQFSVSSLYYMLDTSESCSVTKIIWNNLSPPKVQFFGWLAWKGRRKTSYFLRRIGVLGPGASVLCQFCQLEDEVVSHLLLWCSFAWRVWSCVMDWWGLPWAMPRNVEDLLGWWFQVG